MIPMQGLERDIIFGPFKTEHHRVTVDHQFRHALMHYLAEHVLPQIEGRFTSVVGTVTASFDDPKYFGPRTLVKYRYRVELTFHSPDGVETARGTLDYNPTTATFSEFKRQGPWVESPSSQRKQKVLMRELALIGERYRHGERQFACPFCNAPVHVWYDEKLNGLKDVNCSANCFRVHFD